MSDTRQKKRRAVIPPAVPFEGVGLNFVVKVDLESLSEALNPQQLSAFMGGIAQILAAQKRDSR